MNQEGKRQIEEVYMYMCRRVLLEEIELILDGTPVNRLDVPTGSYFNMLIGRDVRGRVNW